MPISHSTFFYSNRAVKSIWPYVKITPTLRSQPVTLLDFCNEFLDFGKISHLRTCTSKLCVNPASC